MATETANTAGRAGEQTHQTRGEQAGEGEKGGTQRGGCNGEGSEGVGRGGSRGDATTRQLTEGRKAGSMNKTGSMNSEERELRKLLETVQSTKWE